MKVIIDLIENIRESIANAEGYHLYAGLLKQDEEDASKLIYKGEAPVGTYVLDEAREELLFHVAGEEERVSIGALIPSLLILDMQSMMYPLKVEVNRQHRDMEIIGFGKNEVLKRYILFIKV